MATDYISREAAIEKSRNLYPSIDHYCISINAVPVRDLNAIPSADVAPVIHAHWIHTGEYLTNSDGKRLMKLSDLYVCHRCNRVEGAPEPYCNCGAKMDEDMEEDTE